MTRKRTGIKRDMEGRGIPNPQSPRLLSLKKAAEYMGMTVWAMRERIWAGHLPVVQFPGGRKMYLDVFDLDDFVERHKRTIT